jgi:signal peptidase II
MSRRWKIFLVVGVLSLVADQITKIWARGALPTVPGPGGRTYGLPVEVIPNFWDWRLSHNPGAAFGLFSSTDTARIFLSVIGILAIFAIFWMVKKAREDQTRLSVALGLVAGGAIGNLVDRIAFGVVTDFVVWKYHDTEWPTFNVADVTLVIGVALLFIDMGKEARLEAQQARAEQAHKAADTGKGQKNQKPKKKR